MANRVWVLPLALAFAFVSGVTAQNTKPDWAFLMPDKVQPPATEEEGPQHVPGSDKAYTAKEVDNLSNPPDWFPSDHPTAPAVVQHGQGAVLACGSCHLMSGHGHPESADLAGMPAGYIVHTMHDFKTGARIDPARMNAIAKGMSDEEIQQAADYFAALKPGGWVKVMETKTVPKSYVSVRGRARMPLPGGGTEALGNRIIELPEDARLASLRDARSPFIAYVPVGSIRKGEMLVKTGGHGKTIECSICHGDNLAGLADVPRLAGLHPLYVGRQLYAFQTGTNHSVDAALMKRVVAKLTAQDILDISAYLAAQQP